MRRVLLRAVSVLIVLVALIAPAAVPATGGAAGPSLRHLVGQLILARMQGTRPSPAFLARIRHGQIGGIVVYGDNYGPEGPKGLVSELQRQAAAGGQPPLLVGIDQEGGSVKRLPGAPSLAPDEMANTTIAEAQGLATARNLAGEGVTTDLAPVLDIGRGGFITARAFAATPAVVAARATAFARGLKRGGILATGKHFPGLGYARTNTDTTATVITATRRQLLTDLLPYRTAIRAGLPIVMVSTAVYPNLADTLPAACSPTIISGLLRDRLGFHGLVITDDLETAAVNHYLPTPAAAVHAINAGADMVLAAGTSSDHADNVSRNVYAAILHAAQTGTIPTRTLQAAYQHVLTAKTRLAHQDPIAPALADRTAPDPRAHRQP